MRATCEKCGAVVGWSARRGARLAELRHRDCAWTDCDGTLKAYRDPERLRQIREAIDASNSVLDVTSPTGTKPTSAVLKQERK